jgi:H+/Cl- antiporter ClcA
MKLIATLVVAVAIIAVIGTAIALHLKPSNGPTRTERQELGPVGRWISGLLTSAIFGALAILLLDLLASWIAPEYWGQPNSWNAAGAGAVAGMLSHCFNLRKPRQSENPN